MFNVNFTNCTQYFTSFQVIAVARTCSLIFIVLDVLKPLQHKKIIEKELEGFGMRSVVLHSIGRLI